jgi:ATP/ADP translocase
MNRDTEAKVLLGILTVVIASAVTFIIFMIVDSIIEQKNMHKDEIVYEYEDGNFSKAANDIIFEMDTLNISKSKYYINMDLSLDICYAEVINVDGYDILLYRACGSDNTHQHFLNH